MADPTLSIDSSDIQRFYRAALVGLAALDKREQRGRRLGPDADARWRAFRGALGEADRLEWLLRDAAVTQPLGFAPRAIFSLVGMTKDEPFGRSWPRLHEPLAIELLSQLPDPPPTNLAAFLNEVVSVWGLSPKPLAESAVSHLKPASRVVAAGAGAVLALLPLFAERHDFDLADQVLLVADGAGVRQMFGLGAAWLPASRPPSCFGTAELAAGPPRAAAHAAGFDRLDEALISDDATGAEREAAARLLGEQVG